jgi:hypothetical protein
VFSRLEKRSKGNKSLRDWKGEGMLSYVDVVDASHFIAELGMYIPSFAIECRATIRIGRGSGQIPYKLEEDASQVE